MTERGGVGKHVAAADRLDNPDPIARVARQARVALRMDVLGAHAVARLETGLRVRGSREGPARQRVRDFGGRERARDLFPRAQGVSGFDLVGIGEAHFDDEFFQPYRPLLVVGRRQVEPRRQALNAVACLIDGPDAGVAHGAIEREGASLPLRVEDWLVRLGLDFAEAVHATYVVDAVHHAASLGSFGRPVPIMQSRVTSDASLSSLQPSVPAGRMGSTMKRVSAVESQTRMSVPGGRVTPKSARTP